MLSTLYLKGKNINDIIINNIKYDKQMINKFVCVDYIERIIDDEYNYNLTTEDINKLLKVKNKLSR